MSFKYVCKSPCPAHDDAGRPHCRCNKPDKATCPLSITPIWQLINPEVSNIEELKKRDRVMSPKKVKYQVSDKTDIERSYYICPACGLVLNLYDHFCRYCGQRMRED